ncbi:resolvase [bacterium]|nr:resolvase [bacterium]
MMVLAVDPGRRKCGLALVTGQLECVQRSVVAREDLLHEVRQWLQRWGVQRVLVGGATGSKPVVQELKEGLTVEVEVVSEYKTSERARGRYFRDHPPRGVWRWVPLGLQVPPVPIDDYAALVMAEDYLNKIQS